MGPWVGSVWRMHRSRYDATSYRGSELVSARYHRAPDQFPPERCFPALYTALSAEICIAELIRHTPPEDIENLIEMRLSELEVTLQSVLDMRKSHEFGVDVQRLLDDRDYSLSQELASVALARGCDALLVPSATGLGDNLILFPSRCRDYGSAVQCVRSRDLSRVRYIGADSGV